MKKLLFGLVLGVGLIGGGWFAAREHFAQANADQYLSKREIPLYHLLSFHGRDDLNLLGFCRPCGDKARQVMSDKVGKEFEQTKRDLEKAIDGK